MKKRIVVLGTGYVGLPAALMFARAGWPVVGVDINENVVAAINQRSPLIKDAELNALMADPAVHANLTASTSVIPGDIYVLAVPTPLHAKKKIADLNHVVAAMEAIMPHLVAGNLIIVESTVPPLACRDLLAPMVEKHTGLRVPQDVMMAHCPERLLPGDIIYEIVHNDRIIGGMDEASTRAATEVYASFVKGDLLPTDDVTAALCKLMENTYRDVNIALANEMCEVAEGLGVNWQEAFRMANRHPRVSYLEPSIGVGGHCIPIDPWFIKEVDPINTRLIEASRRINDERPAKVAARIRRAVAGLPNPRIVAIGSTYKPDSEDCRESPAIEVVRLLRADGYDVGHFDPMMADMGYSSLTEVARDADLLAVLVRHRRVLQELDEHGPAIQQAMRHPTILTRF